MSQRVENLWSDFLQGIRGRNEDEVKRILLETSNLNLGGGKSNFLTRKIHTTQGILTPLHLAVKHSAERIIKLLLESGVNVNITSQPHKFTALHMAIEQGHKGITQLLLSHEDINVNATDEYGHTPLKLASEKGNQQTVKWLIEKGADITKADLVDNTAIHVAADKGHYGVLQLLLQVARNSGIIGKQNKDKNTPLHLAVGQECSKSVALLLCYGAAASMELENRHNETPKQLARRNRVIMELLENPSKAKRHLMEVTRPVVKRSGRGGSVEADSGHDPEQIISQPSSASLATVLSQATPGFQPTIMYVTTPQVTVKNEYHTKVGNGGYAAIGTQSALHVGQSAVTPAGVQPQLPSAGESSYSINVSGGNASVGDCSVINVGTATPRTSRAGTTETERLENRDSRSPQTLANSSPMGTDLGNRVEKENTPGEGQSSDVGSVGSPVDKAQVPSTPGTSSCKGSSGKSAVNPALLQKRTNAAKKSGVLDFSHIGLLSFPENLYGVNRRLLTKLDLSHNMLIELPELIGDLINLKDLSANDNQLTLLPRAIKQLQQLQELDVRNNKLKSVVQDTSDLIRLERLSVEGNPLRIEEVRSLMELVERRQSLWIDIAVIAPAEIRARGHDAQAIYEMALRDGYVNVYRGRILLLGQDRAGKTSLKKYLLGLPFDPEEESTVGIDPSKFEIHADRIKNWSCNSENKTLLSEVSRGVARVVAEKKYLSILAEGDDSAMESDGVSPRQESKYKAMWDVDNGSETNQFAKDADGLKDANISAEQSNGAGCPGDGGDVSKEAADFLLKKLEMLPPAEVTEHADKCFKQILREGHQAVYSANKEDSMVVVDLWDFAGQHLYYASHPVFLSPRAVYVVVHNLSKPLDALAEPCVRQGTHDVILENPNSETNLDNLLSWLFTVHQLKPRGEEKNKSERQVPYLRPPVFIVGTHADQPFEDTKTMISQIEQRISGEEYAQHVIRPLFSIDNTQGVLSGDNAQSNMSPWEYWTKPMKNLLWPDPQAGCDSSVPTGDGIVALRDRIMEVLRQEPYMGEKIPIRWLTFETVIDCLVAESFRHINVRRLQTIAEKVCFITDEDEFHTVLNFYHDLGLIVKHRDTVFLDARWLIDLFRQLITIPRFDKADPLYSQCWREVEESGILQMELVEHVFSKFKSQRVEKEDILDMMEQFGLIAKYTSTATSTKYFVPAQLKTTPKSICKLEPSPSDPCPLYLHFAGGFVPHGLFTQLVSRFISWCCKTWKTEPPSLYRNGAWFVVGKQVVCDFILLCKKSFIKIVLKQRKQDSIVSKAELAAIARRVCMFIEEVLQMLSNELPCLSGLQHQLCVACPHCLADCPNHQQALCPHEDCLHLFALKKGQRFICTKVPRGCVKTVPGMEKWLSLRNQGLNLSRSVATRGVGDVESDSENSAKPLNVTLLASEWGSSMGGLSTINRELAIQLAKHDLVKVTFLVPKFECREEEKRDAESYNIAIREVPPLPGFDDPLDWLRNPPRDLTIDIIVGHGAKLGKHAQLIKTSHGCKWVQVVHTAPEELGAFKDYARARGRGEEKNRAEVDLCTLSDLVVTVGSKLREVYSSYLRFCKKHQYIFQLTPGIFHEFSMLEQATMEEGKFKVLTFGRGDSEDFSLKGYDIAAEAVVELKDSSYCLVFVGAPIGKQDEVAQHLLQTGIAKDQLIVREFVQSKERLKELFCEVDLAIMPSRTEGFGLTALEALSAGVPILVSGNSGFAHVLRDLPSGESFLVNFDDPKKWAKAIAAVRRKRRSQRLQDVQALRTSYEAKYNWEEQCRALVEKMWSMIQDG